MNTKGFQFTASYEADRTSASRPGIRLIFQFTASYEADLTFKLCCVMSESFQFTASYEADQDKQGNLDRERAFQFTASYEADLLIPQLSVSREPFNSQPHTRLTQREIVDGSYEDLSIHSLIRG